MLLITEFVVLVQYSLPHLRKTKGSLIQDSSLVAEIGQPGAPMYVATKVHVCTYLLYIASYIGVVSIWRNINSCK